MNINMENTFKNLLRGVEELSIGKIFSIKDVINYNTWKGLNDTQKQEIGKKFREAVDTRMVCVRICNAHESGVNIYEKQFPLFIRIEDKNEQ